MILRFKAYGVHGGDVSILSNRITHWERIDYNGNVGTRIYLDTGVEVLVSDYPTEVEKKVNAAL